MVMMYYMKSSKIDVNKNNKLRYCEITQDLLEDVNAHKYCNKIYEIIDIMKSMHLPDNIILDFAKRFTHHMFDNYGY